MSKPYRPIVVIVGLVVALVVAAVVRKLVEPKEVVAWRTDLAAAREEAKQSGRPMLLYFTASWCGPCQQMKSATWADKRVAEAVAGYVAVKIDVDEQAAVAREWQVSSIPAMFVVSASGETVASTVGYQSPAQLLMWLEMGQPASRPAVLENVDVERFDRLRKEKAIVLDVRTAGEYGDGHIAEAVHINIKSREFDAEVGKLDKERAVLVYCASGYRSARACERMKKLGFGNLYNLEGGIHAWEKAKKLVEK